MRAAPWPATQSLPGANAAATEDADGLGTTTGARMPHRRRREEALDPSFIRCLHSPRSRLCARRRRAGLRPPPRIALISTSMSNLSQKDPPELSEATTGRSKCQRCREPILKGEQRVGMLTRTSRSLRTCGLRHQPPAYRTYLWRWAAAGAPRTYAVRVPASLGACRTYRVPWHHRRVGMVGRSSGISVRKWDASPTTTPYLIPQSQPKP